jgi:hypothetical protein
MDCTRQTLIILRCNAKVRLRQRSVDSVLDKTVGVRLCGTIKRAALRHVIVTHADSGNGTL